MAPDDDKGPPTYRQPKLRREMRDDEQDTVPFYQSRPTRPRVRSREAKIMINKQAIRCVQHLFHAWDCSLDWHMLREGRPLQSSITTTCSKHRSTVSMQAVFIGEPFRPSWVYGSVIDRSKESVLKIDGPTSHSFSASGRAPPSGK